MKSVTYSSNTISSMLDDLFMIGFGSNYNTPRSTGFPFYNVVKIDEDTFGVELAIAGFSQDDIDISEHKSSLIIKGERGEDERDYIYRGITSKKFIRTFALAEHVHVASARMKDGILQIVLKREVPEEKKPKRIAIGS